MLGCGGWGVPPFLHARGQQHPSSLPSPGAHPVTPPPHTQTQKDAGAVEKIMQDLDENGDGEVDFQEYVVLVAALTVACNTFFWENA